MRALVTTAPWGAGSITGGREPQPLTRVNAFEVLIGDRELGFAHVGALTSEAVEPHVQAQNGDGEITAEFDYTKP
jgi:hypothetical protein